MHGSKKFRISFSLKKCCTNKIFRDQICAEPTHRTVGNKVCASMDVGGPMFWRDERKNTDR